MEKVAARHQSARCAVIVEHNRPCSTSTYVSRIATTGLQRCMQRALAARMRAYSDRAADEEGHMPSARAARPALSGASVCTSTKHA